MTFCLRRPDPGDRPRSGLRDRLSKRCPVSSPGCQQRPPAAPPRCPNNAPKSHSKAPERLVSRTFQRTTASTTCKNPQISGRARWPVRGIRGARSSQGWPRGPWVQCPSLVRDRWPARYQTFLGATGLAGLAWDLSLENSCEVLFFKLHNLLPDQLTGTRSRGRARGGPTKTNQTESRVPDPGQPGQVRP